MTSISDSSPRDRMLDAAERVVLAKGVGGLTLDAVAREAGASKGGLLHYFASKEALLNAMLERMTALVDSVHERTVGNMPPGPGRVAKAVLAWAFGQAELSPGDERHDRLAAVFLSAFHRDPALLAPLRASYARLKAELIADGLAPGDALVLMTACDGIFMAHMFKTVEFSAAEMSAMRATLERLIGGNA